MEVNYCIKYQEEVVRKHIPALASNVKSLIKRSIEIKLINNPIRFGKPLRYSMKGYRSLRVGDYRIIYKIEIDTKVVTIIAIKHRKSVYN